MKKACQVPFTHVDSIPEMPSSKTRYTEQPSKNYTFSPNDLNGSRSLFTYPHPSSGIDSRNFFPFSSKIEAFAPKYPQQYHIPDILR